MPTFALMGEFSAGKSSLLNLILGETVLPTKVTATNMPVIWMTYGETVTAQSLSYDGKFRDFDPADLAEQGPKGHLLIRLSMPSETLLRSDVIDTPGISDRRLDANALNFIQPYLDFVVWCSPANQAWRQTEKAVWQKMPALVHEHSILALTRADTMSKANDLKKVINRCKTETEGTFRIVQPIATVVAQRALDADGNIIDQDKWNSSRAEELFTAIKDSMRIARLNCAIRDEVEVPADEQFGESKTEEAPEALEDLSDETDAHMESSAPSDDDAETLIAEDATTADDTRQTEAETLPHTRNANIDTLLCQLRQLDDVTSTKDQFFTNLEHLFSQFTCDKTVSEAHQLVLNRAMSLDGSSQVPPQMVKAQLVREIEDFAHNPWCQLDKVH